MGGGERPRGGDEPNNGKVGIDNTNKLFLQAKLWLQRLTYKTRAQFHNEGFTPIV